MTAEQQAVLPEVTLLLDARGPRPEDAVGVGEFWYEPEVWSLPLSPASKVLYAGLCSHLPHGQINRHDLRAIPKNSSDEEIAAALAELVGRGLLAPNAGSSLTGYVVRSVEGFGD